MYVGSDTACFFPISNSGCMLIAGESTLGMSTKGAPLSFMPDSDFTAPSAGGTVDLGTFDVSSSLAGAVAGTFDIKVSFTEPAGSGGQTFTASTLGLVVLGRGGVEITFNDPTTQEFDYPGGAFDLSLPSSTILIGAGHSMQLDAVITPLTTAVATPEPASISTVVVGLMLVGLVLYRRRKSPAHSAATIRL